MTINIPNVEVKQHPMPPLLGMIHPLLVNQQPATSNQQLALLAFQGAMLQKAVGNDQVVSCMSQKGDKNMWDNWDRLIGLKSSGGLTWPNQTSPMFIDQHLSGIGHGEKLPNETPRIGDQIS